MFLLYPKAGPSGSQGKEVLRPGAGHQPSPVAPESHNRGSKAQKWAIASQQQCLQPQTPPHTHSPFLSLSPTMHPHPHTPCFSLPASEAGAIAQCEKKGKEENKREKEFQIYCWYPSMQLAGHFCSMTGPQTLEQLMPQWTFC